jgi:exocyst complex component 2
VSIYGTTFAFGHSLLASGISRVLSELQSSDEPVWMYFDSHHKHILDQMTNVYQFSMATIEGKPEGESFSHPTILG